MTPDIFAWLKANVPADPTGTCREVTAALVAAFPSYRRVRGHYFCPVAGQAFPHWWCVAPDGTVLDPTRDQFPSRGLGCYEEHEGPEPTGRCPNCGGYCYENRDLCSPECEISYRAYLMGGF